MKRQRWLAKTRGGAGYPGGPDGRRVQQHQPAQAQYLQQAAQKAPGSPLSRLVAEGYPRTAQPAASAHQPYGERDRPPSGQAAPWGAVAAGGQGFNSAVAGQWNADVASDVRQRQQRHDPNVSGPKAVSGGQRITQAPGGGSSIDLSWGGAAPTKPQAMPPRQPQAAFAPPQQPYYGGQAQQAQPSYSGQAAGGCSGMRHPSPGAGGRNSGVSQSPWGRDDDVGVAAPRQVRRDAPPFGMDMAPAQASAHARAGSRGPPQQDLQAAGVVRGVGGRATGRTPGGQSQVVFG